LNVNSFPRLGNPFDWKIITEREIKNSAVG
jgi:hypothetical protein